MPSKSQAQHRAMEAAAHGKSTLGIPAKVGKDFAVADAAKGKGAVKKLPRKKNASRSTAEKMYPKQGK